ncbi:MAG: hypothetical protein ACREM3_06670 [Candidatus Rokuibacteriota bacterium]
MSPGGHLLTTAAACVSAAVTTGSPGITAGIALGGFLIDVDHAIDYVLFEGQRDLRPAAFLRYYMEGRARRAVLVLHSYELLAVLAWLAWSLDAAPLAGYVFGAVMHLGLDLRYNGEYTPRSIAAFYSFGYRLAHRFDTGPLLAYAAPPVAWAGFWATFFGGIRRGRTENMGGRDMAPRPGGAVASLDTPPGSSR